MKRMQLREDALIQELDRLQAKLASAEAENARLREQVAFFTTQTWMAKGIKGETIIAQLLNCARTKGNASYDIEGTLHLEVKYSRLTDNGTGVLRWTWGTVFGGGGKKNYDRLILLGDSDPVHCNNYLDPESPYVLFDVPFSDVSQLITNGGTAGDHIRLSSNPQKARGRSMTLFSEYQVTQKSLESKDRVSEDFR